MLQTQETALIVEGGAMRGVFSAGILDEFMAHHFYPFDLYIGVSAGASNLASYLAEKPKRNYQIYTDLCRRREFKSLKRFIRGGHLIDIDWLWEISDHQFPVDFELINQRQRQFLITVTNVETGQAEYLSPSTQDMPTALKASSCMPLAYRHPIELYGKKWVDGGVAESLPVKEAYARGAKQIMVLRSNPRNYIKKPYKIAKLLPFILKDTPQVAKRLQRRYQDYNQAVNFIRNPPKDCKIIEHCPPENFNASQFTLDIKVLNEAYKMGKKEGLELIKNWRQPLS